MSAAIFRIIGVVLMLSGCSLQPEYRRPPVITPVQWKNQPSKTVAETHQISPHWWNQFGNPELDRLIMEALANNLDLSAAMLRIGQFRGLAKIAGAPLFPALSAAGSYEFNEGSRFGNDANIWQGRWNLSYEADLWGGIRAGRDSAKGLLDKARFSYDALRLTVMGDIAQSYFAIVGLKDRKRIAENNLKNINDVLDIILARFEAGAVSALDVAQQQTERANAAASVALLDQQIAQSENAFAVLIGRPPQLFKVVEASLEKTQIPKADLYQSQTLLDRRPDIRSAEVELMAAHADIGQARAAFYPRLQLGADNIFTAAALSQPAGIAVALAASLTAPIFQGGRLEGELERTLARRTELLEIYRKTLLIAYQEVEDALALGGQSARRREQLLVAVENAEKAYGLALERYLAGATDFQTLLIVQRSLFNAQDSEVQAHIDVLTAAVLLFKSLGGGWSQPQG